MKNIHKQIEISFGVLVFLLVIIPVFAYASGFLNLVGSLFSSAQSSQTRATNSQNIALLQASGAPENSTSTGAITIVSGTSLASVDTDSPVVTAPQSDQISLYVVHAGDTLSGIAHMFGVSTNTIIWANNIKGGKVSPGDELVILPISGVEYTIKSGDTVKSIATKLKGDATDIASFNNISVGDKLAVGDTLIIPDGEMSVTSSTKSQTQTNSKSNKILTAPAGSSPYYSPAVGTHGPNFPVIIGYYERPLIGGIKTQGIHGHNAVDLASAYGTSIMASADGTVIVARSGGWNGGYGSYVVINHANGTQTLYGHMSQVDVSVGEVVTQGQIIGKMGSTGDSTGNHVHFEIRGATNPF